MQAGRSAFSLDTGKAPISDYSSSAKPLSLPEGGNFLYSPSLFSSLSPIEEISPLSSPRHNGPDLKASCSLNPPSPIIPEVSFFYTPTVSEVAIPKRYADNEDYIRAQEDAKLMDMQAEIAEYHHQLNECVYSGDWKSYFVVNELKQQATAGLEWLQQQTLW